MSSSSNFGKFIVGTVVGGAVGAVIGMLLAPRSGAETREMIREEFETRRQNASEAVRDKSAQVKEKAVALRGSMQEAGNRLEEKGRQAVSKFTERNASNNASESPQS